MANYGKSITVFLMDGIASGKIMVTIGNWSGVAYKIPRSKLMECNNIKDLENAGIYFLFGSQTVYIGQAEVRSNGAGIQQRILEHTADRLKETWDEAVIFTGTDNTLGKSEISFLEFYFYGQAINAKSYNVLNNNTPSKGTLTASKESVLLEYADMAELILGVLGYKVFESVKNNKLPPLPSKEMKIGQFVYSAMDNLSQSGYIFSKDEIDQMCTTDWAKEHFQTKYPFMKRYIKGKTDNKGIDGRTRFKAVYYTFGKENVYISKEWFERQRASFIKWYNSLK